MTAPLSSDLYRHLLTIRGHAGSIYSLQYDGVYIYSASADKYVTRWSVLHGTQDKFAIKFEDVPYSLLLVNDNKFLLVGTNTGKLHVFDLALNKEIKCFIQHESAVFSLLSNPSKKHFYSADASGNVAVWSLDTWNLLLFLPTDCGKIRRMVLDKEGKKMFFASQDGYITILETDYFNVIHNFQSHKDGATSLMLCEEENYLFTGGKDALLKSWDLSSGLELKVLPAHNFVIYDIVKLNDKNFATVSRDKSIKIWSKNSLEVLLKIDAHKNGHHHSVNNIIALDERRFVTCSDDKTIRVFGY